MRTVVSLLVFSLLTGLGAPAQAQVLTSLFSVRSPINQNDGFFGSVVEAAGDVDGDGVPDLLVGAPDEQGARGNAYYYSGTDGTLLRAFASPVATTDGFFARALASTGDVNADGVPDFLAGSNHPVGGQAVAGTVYLISGADGAVLRTLTSPNAQENGFFGFNVAAPGDLDGDGTGDYVVGAGDEDLELAGSLRVDHGAVYAFSGADGRVLWTSTPLLGSSFIYYGRVAPLGDVNADGVPDLLASAVRSGTGGSGAGEAFVIDGTDGTVLHSLLSGNAQQDGAFGWSLAGIGDVTGDGVPDAAVGAPFEGVGGTSVRDGTVSFFNGATGARIGTYVEEERQEDRFYGWAIRNVGDYDGDGVDDVGISAPRQFNRFEFLPPPLAAPFSGALFITSGATIGQEQALDLAEVYPSLPDFPTTFSWNYGRAFAPLGDTNGDGLNEIAIGAPTQGANIGFVGVLDGARIQALSDVGAEAEAEEVVGPDGTYTFEGTAVTLTLDLVDNADDAPRPARGGGATVVVTRYRNAPLDTGGIPEEAVAQYRWTVVPERDLRLVAAESEIRFSLAGIPGAGIVDPAGIVVYRRQYVGGGDFEPLTTTYDAATDEIIATGFSRLGEFVFASDTNPLPADEAPPGAALAVTSYPNPATDVATVEVVLAEAADVRVEVVDVLGRRVALLADGARAAGTHALPFETAGLPAGLYVIRAMLPDATLVRRISLAP